MVQVIKQEKMYKTNMCAEHMYIKFDNNTVAYAFKDSFEAYGLTTQEHVNLIKEIVRNNLTN